MSCVYGPRQNLVILGPTMGIYFNVCASVYIIHCTCVDVYISVYLCALYSACIYLHVYIYMHILYMYLFELRIFTHLLCECIIRKCTLYVYPSSFHLLCMYIVDLRIHVHVYYYFECIL